VIDVLDREVELVVVAFATAEFGATVSQHPRQLDAMLIIEWKHPIVEDLGRGDRRLAVIEFGEGDPTAPARSVTPSRRRLGSNSVARRSYLYRSHAAWPVRIIDWPGGPTRWELPEISCASST
jgi:hypothetical protein